MGKEIQIIDFEKEKGKENKYVNKKLVLFDAIPVDTKKLKFNKEEANER